MNTRAKRMSPNDRRKHILDAIMPLARAQGYQAVSWSMAAATAQVSESLIRKYFGTRAQLQRGIISHAIATKDARIIAQGVAAGDSKARRAPVELLLAAAEIVRSVR